VVALVPLPFGSTYLKVIAVWVLLQSAIAAHAIAFSSRPGHNSHACCLMLRGYVVGRSKTAFSPLFSRQITCYGWKLQPSKFTPRSVIELGIFQWLFQGTVATIFLFLPFGGRPTAQRSKLLQN
jgi:hypothetical protein